MEVGGSKQDQAFQMEIAVNRILATRENLNKKGDSFGHCPLYHNSGDYLQHLFLECDFSRAIWFCSELFPYISSDSDITCWLQK